jgi:hypothetical protein
MNSKRAVFSAVAAFTFSFAVAQGGEVLDFSALVGAGIQFNGTASSFQFNNNAGGNQWQITLESGGTGSALGLVGRFNGGPWSYGPITTSGFDETANVNLLPTATFTITDGGGNLATANVTWGQVSTYRSIGGLNASLSVNLSSLSYSGSNPDLLTFFSAGAGQANVSFQFNPSQDLNALTSGAGPYTTSFSGSLAVVPEPTSALLFGLGLALFGFRSFRRK